VWLLTAFLLLLLLLVPQTCRRPPRTLPPGGEEGREGGRKASGTVAFMPCFIYYSLHFPLQPSFHPSLPTSQSTASAPPYDIAPPLPVATTAANEVPCEKGKGGREGGKERGRAGVSIKRERMRAFLSGRLGHRENDQRVPSLPSLPPSLPLPPYHAPGAGKTSKRPSWLESSQTPRPCPQETPRHPLSDLDEVKREGGREGGREEGGREGG